MKDQKTPCQSGVSGKRNKTIIEEERSHITENRNECNLLRIDKIREISLMNLKEI